MFSFFIKKHYLVDHLNGLIDIHNHILPGIDDGAKTVEDSIHLINGFREFGVKKFICTPHIMHNYYDNTPKIIKKAYKSLMKVLNEKNFDDIKVDFAAEHMIDDNFEILLKKNKVLPLRKKHLLVEMSYLQPSINFDIAIKKIKENNFFPVFAHPERYHYLHKDSRIYNEYKSKGIYFQLNMLSLSSYYGNDIQAMAFKLLDEGKYEFIGSDVHKIKHLEVLKNSVCMSNKRLDKIRYVIDNTIESFY